MSFVNKAGQPEPYNIEQPEEIRRSIIDNLDQETYKELIAAVNKHEERQDAELIAKKNAQATASTS